MRGRKPTPTAVLKMRGSARADARGPEPTGELLAVDGVPEPPKWFDAAARDKYTELAGLLVAMRVLTAGDVDLLAAYAAAFSRWHRAERKLKEAGELVTFSNGTEGRSHWLAIAEAALDRMSKAGAELGLSPTARARLRVSPSSPPSGIAKFLRRE